MPNLTLKQAEAVAPVKQFIIDALLGGEVVCNIGQINPATQRVIDKMIRRGEVVKWRGYWYPVAGASFGIGPLKSCYGLTSRYLPCSIEEGA